MLTDFVGNQFIVSRSLSALTAITSLHIVFDSESMPVELSWLGHLLSLQSIKLLLSTPFVSLPASISQLTQLTYLHVRNGLTTGQIETCFAWSNLATLQMLSISGSLQLSRDHCGLATLVSLKRVALSSCRAPTNCILGHKLGVNRPDVDFVTSL